MSLEGLEKSTKTSPNVTIFEHFKLFRKYANHEDDLINHRLLWNINIQGFLFATYGFSVQKLAEVLLQEKVGVQDEKTVLYCLPLFVLIVVLPAFGIVISVLSLKGVQAAQLAIENLNYQWLEIVNTLYQSNDLAIPMLIGGGGRAIDRSSTDHEKAHKWGFLAPIWLPKIFGYSWLLLLLGSLAFLIWYFAILGKQ
jgi:hypothetical protein